MRFFKHMTNSSQDERIIRLEEEFGLEGYAAYFKVLEIIGSQFSSENQQVSVTFSLKTWRKLLTFPPKKMQNFATFAEKVGLFIVKLEGDDLTIECRNLLKYRDEYSKKKEREASKSPDKVQTKSRQTPEPFKDKDKDKDKDKESEAGPSEDHLAFANGMFSKIKHVAPKTKKPNLTNWANELRIMSEQDGLTLPEMASVFRFANADEFWQTNILSPSSFRKQFAKLHAQMNQSNVIAHPAKQSSYVPTPMPKASEA